MLSEEKLNRIAVATNKEEDEEDLAFYLDNKIKLMVAQIANLMNDKENLAVLLESTEARISSSEFIIQSLEEKLCESEAEKKANMNLMILVQPILKEGVIALEEKATLLEEKATLLEEKATLLGEIATLLEEKERQAIQTVWIKSVSLFL